VRRQVGPAPTGLRMTALDPEPELVRLPWSRPLEEWDDDPRVVDLPRGLSRHVVRIVRVGDRLCAIKETERPVAEREYQLLRELRHRGLPAVKPRAVVYNRRSDDGTELPAALITRHLRYSMPYRMLFSHGLHAESLPALVDALVVLLVRLHLAHFYWGDVSLSNVLFRRNAGEFAAYLVDAETGEFHSTLSNGMREYDVEVGCQNVYAELLDLQAGGMLEDACDPADVVELLQTRYDELWTALNTTEEFDADQLWQIEQWVDSLNEMGFDVEEMDIETMADGTRVQLRPRVVEAGHHTRELQGLTGLVVEDALARRMLNDMGAFAAYWHLSEMPREYIGQRWLRETYEPLVARMPAEYRATLDPAQFFHDVLVHRWFLSERAGEEVGLWETVDDYVENVLPGLPQIARS
jgi:hypothetical protein